jgi:hypothetical protein
MKQIDRRTFIKGLGGAVTLAPGMSFAPGTAAAQAPPPNPQLNRINRSYLIAPRQARDWHAEKDRMGGPTIAGSPSWHNFLQLVERELRTAGVTDLFRNAWTYTRWSTSEFPDDSKWSLHVDGKKVRVASYGCNSGSTPDEGVTGDLVVFEDGMTADALRGKIVIFATPEARARIRGSGELTPGDVDSARLRGDYEYLSDADTFPNPLVPRLEAVGVSPFGQMGLGSHAELVRESGAAGVLLALGLSYDAMSGIYTFPVPALYDTPTLYLDYETGKGVIDAANIGRRATLRLVAETEESETYQLFGYLPGKNYGTPKDEQILLITHTDGPSISQENGALGILGIVKYFANIPRAERPRSLMVFLDCRHYMPGQERAFAANDYAASHPDIYARVVAAMGIEHLGQMQVAEGGGRPYHRTGAPELSTVWITNNPRLVDIAIGAVKDNHLARVQVQCPGRKGLHGGDQGPWYGLGRIAERIGVPGASAMGSMSAYWSNKARMDYLDADHFVDQVATMSQICGELMLAELASIGGKA